MTSGPHSYSYNMYVQTLTLILIQHVCSPLTHILIQHVCVPLIYILIQCVCATFIHILIQHVCTTPHTHWLKISEVIYKKVHHLGLGIVVNAFHPSSREPETSRSVYEFKTSLVSTVSSQHPVTIRPSSLKKKYKKQTNLLQVGRDGPEIKNKGHSYRDPNPVSHTLMVAYNHLCKFTSRTQQLSWPPDTRYAWSTQVYMLVKHPHH